MRKSLATAMAALTFGGAIAATAAPAQAQPRHYYRHHGHHNGNSTGTAVAAGVVGLALGAALASSNSNRGGGYYNRSYAYSDPYYGDRYYSRGDRYYRGDRYANRTCESTRWVWDPYIQQEVRVRSTYRC